MDDIRDFLLVDDGDTALEPYVPPTVVSGICPHVPGREEEMVWHAAAAACDSERVSIAWSAYEGCVYYIAARSADLASHPDTWCPFAALLPGRPRALGAPAVYLHQDEDQAALLVIGVGFIRVHRGSTSMMTAQAERASRELGGIEIRSVNELEGALPPVPWRSLGLLDDRARRRVGRLMVLSGVFAAATAGALCAVGFMYEASRTAELGAMRAAAAQAGVEMLNSARALAGDPSSKVLADLLRVDAQMLKIGGTLTRYEHKDGRTAWSGTVPLLATTPDSMQSMGAVYVGQKDGVALIKHKE